MWLKAAVAGAAIAAFAMEPALAMGGRPDKAPDGTGAGTVLLSLNGRAIPLTWVYATVKEGTTKVFASNEALERFLDWPTLLDDGHQIIIEYTVSKRLYMAYSWGPGRATARVTYNEAQLAAASWFTSGTTTKAAWKTTIPVPKGALGGRDIVLGVDVDLKRAPPAD